MRIAAVAALIALAFSTQSPAESQTGDRAWLGIRATIRESQSGSRFVYVVQVGPDTPAERAGIRAGDVLVRIGSRRGDFKDQLEFLQFVSSLQVGEKLDVVVVRAGARRVHTVLVGRLPQAYEEAWKASIAHARELRAKEQSEGESH